MVKRGTPMTNRQFENEAKYQINMNFFSSLLRDNIISHDEYILIRDKMLEKYNPPAGGFIAEVEKGQHDG